MHRLLASIRKEIILLSRDWAGLGLLFVMPAVLIIVMSLIQDITFKKVSESHLTILYLDIQYGKDCPQMNSFIWLLCPKV